MIMRNKKVKKVVAEFGEGTFFPSNILILEVFSFTCGAIPLVHVKVCGQTWFP